MSLPADLIESKAAAKLIGVHPTTIIRYTRQGKLRGWRVAGCRVRVSRAEVLALLVPVHREGSHERSMERLRAAGMKV